MRMHKPLRWLLALLLVLSCGLAQAQTQPNTPRIGVLTMGPGDVFWERFGHDAIVVDDPAHGAPISYNFGYFDLDEAGFVGRFAKGEMRYLLVALPLEQDLAYYREVGRGARLQWLTSVSYTHLDVYKRQRFGWPPSWRWGDR